MEKRELALAAVEELKSQGYEVNLTKVIARNNREAICIRTEETNIVPTIYIDTLPDEIETVEDMADWLLACHEANVPKESVDAMKWLTNEYLKEHTWPMLCYNAPNTAVYKDYLGMKEILKIEVSFETSNKEAGYITITDEMLKIIEADREQLFAWAEENIKKAEFYSVNLISAQMEEAIKAGNEVIANELVKQLRDPFLRTIASMQHMVRSKKYGNAGTALMDKEFLKSICEELDTDEVIITPSSIFEIIIVPAEMIPAEFNETIKEINDTMLAPEEVLSYHAFTYSSITNEVSIFGQSEDEEPDDVSAVANNLINGVING